MYDLEKYRDVLRGFYLDIEKELPGPILKTGSLSDDYNLIVLYQQHGKEFLICSLGSQSDSSRYDDVNFILKTINESYYLTQ